MINILTNEFGFGITEIDRDTLVYAYILQSTFVGFSQNSFDYKCYIIKDETLFSKKPQPKFPETTLPDLKKCRFL